MTYCPLIDTCYIFLLGYRVLFCVESLCSQSKHCTWVSPSASSQLKSWESDTSHLSQQTEEGSHSSVICSISAVSLQSLAHDVWDKTPAQYTAELKDRHKVFKHTENGSGLTQHSERCHCHCEVPGAGNSGPADVDACMLHLHIRDHQVTIPKDSGVEDVNGLMVWESSRSGLQGCSSQ